MYIHPRIGKIKYQKHLIHRYKFISISSKYTNSKPTQPPHLYYKSHDQNFCMNVMQSLAFNHDTLLYPIKESHQIPTLPAELCIGVSILILEYDRFASLLSLKYNNKAYRINDVHKTKLEKCLKNKKIDWKNIGSSTNDKNQGCCSSIRRT